VALGFVAVIVFDLNFIAAAQVDSAVAALGVAELGVEFEVVLWYVNGLFCAATGETTARSAIIASGAVSILSIAISYSG